MTEFIKKIDLLNAMARIQPSSENYSSDIAYWYYCSELDKPLKQVNKAVNCDSFILSELCDVDTGKPYKPRIKTVYEGEQIRIEGVGE